MTDGTAIDHAETVPALDPGVTLLSGGPAALHRVVAAELARGRTAGLWVDPGRAVSIYTLADLTPSPRTRSGLQIARAFTAYQHHALVRELVERASARTDLVVLPGIADLYRDEDVPDYERSALFESAVAVAAGLADSYAIPVLLSDEGADDLTALAADYADAEVVAERTDLGLSFRGEGFESLGYWGRDYWQTTIPYWVDLLGVAEPMAPLVASLSPSLDPGSLTASAGPPVEG